MTSLLSSLIRCFITCNDCLRQSDPHQRVIMTLRDSAGAWDLINTLGEITIISAGGVKY